MTTEDATEPPLIVADELTAREKEVAS